MSMRDHLELPPDISDEDIKAQVQAAIDAEQAKGAHSKGTRIQRGQERLHGVVVFHNSDAARVVQAVKKILRG